MTNPTPTRGVPVMLDRERRLRYSLKTIRELREEFGEDVLAAGLPQDAIAKLVWYGLKEEDPDLAVEQVEEMIDLEHLSEVMDAVGQATGNRSNLSLEKVMDPQNAPASPKDAGAEAPTTAT